MQETLLTEIPPLQRATLHASFAEALEAYCGDRADPVQLAYHFAQAAAVAGPEKLVSYTLLAGEHALAAYAWEEAQEHFQRGLHARGVALDSREPAPDAQVAALLFGLAVSRSPLLIGSNSNRPSTICIVLSPIMSRQVASPRR